MNKSLKKIEKTEHSYQSTLGAINYQLIRSNARRTSSISVDEQARVSVYVPFRTTQQYIETFIQDKLNWIDRCVQNAKRNQSIIHQKKFDEGGEFLFLGRKFPLCIVHKDIKRPDVNFDGAKWTVSLPNELNQIDRQQKIKEKLIEWYRLQAQEVVGGRIFHYSRVIGVEPKVIAVRSQKRIWGCCHYKKQQIHINWQIILAPVKVIDYVIVHELCHLVHPNHGQRFWKKVEKHMPEYKEHKKWLRLNQAELLIPQ